MKPKGLVAAASITSHTLMPMRSHIMAISFTSPMLIMRKVFSSSFTISATCVELTGTTCCEGLRVEQPAHLRAGRRDAAHHFGNVGGLVLRIARVHALRRKAQEEIACPLRGRTSQASAAPASSVVPG